MGSFFDKLFGRFTGSHKRTVNSRKLRVESLERRQLMVSDLGAVTGTVYTDLTDNGLTVDDARLSNVTVRLYRDGGNNTFDNGGADDTLVGTTTTNVNGVYTFNDLLAGTYFVQQAAVTGVVQRNTETVKTVTITPAQAAGTAGTTVDAFTTSQTLTANVVGTPVTDVVAAAEAIGGQREMFANLTGGASIDLIANAATPGVLEFNTSPTGAGSRIITYDGTNEADATAVDPTGLGGLDLTNGGNDIAFRFTAGADQAGGSLIIRVYTDLTNFSTLTLPIDNTGGAATATLIARFASFTVGGGTGADFTDVNAIQIEFAVAASDGQLDLIETVGRSVITSNAANLNPMTLGNTVFLDANNNGTKETAEVGIAGVVVDVYDDTNGNGTFDAGIDTLVDTATTNGTGVWTVTDLLPGDYIAVVPASQFLAAAPLFGMISATGNPNPNNDVDDDDNGALVAAVVATAAITLAPSSEPTTDGDGADSNLTLDLGFTPNIDLTVVKSGTATIDAGGNVTYTITVTNNSQIAATNIQVTDDLPVGVTFVPNGTNGSNSSTSWTQQANPNGELLATIATLAAGANQQFTVVVTTDPALVAGNLTNVVTVTSDGDEQTPGDNTDDAVTAITRNATLTLTKSDGTRTTVSPGDTFAYTLTVTNTGLSTANNVTLVDTLPAGYTFVSFGNASQGSPVRTVVGGLDQISAGVTSLAVGATMTVVVNVAVANTIAGTTITNTATADSDDSTAVNATDTNNIVRNLDLSITKTAVAPTVGVGGQATYTLTVTNNGPLDVTGVEVDDDLPAGFTLATTGNPNSIAANANANRDFVWTVGNLASGQSSTVNVIVNVASTFTPATGVTNTATIAVDRLTGFTDTNTANNTATAQVAVEPRFDLRVTKTDGLTTVATGQQISYTIVVDNIGPSAATNVVVTDVLPSYLEFISATSNSASFGTVNNQTYTATIPTLAANETRTITLNVRVRPSATTTPIVNTVTITADNASTQETGTRPNTATDNDTVLNRTVTYTITKTGPTTPVLAGTNFTYTVVAFNSGNADSPNVLFSDPLPAGVTFRDGTFTVNGTSTNGTVTFNSTTNRLEANLGTLLAGGSATVNHATITLNVTAAATATGTVSNTARITSPDNTTGVTSTVTTTINPNFDLTLTKSDGVTSVQVGQNLVYTIVVTNSGPSPASNITVTDTLPTTQLTFVSATSSSGTFTNNNGTVSGNIASLASGATATITITATVRNDVPNGTSISNTASVSAANETTTTNNSATDTTSVATLKTISGFAYNDLNRNGVKDTTDPVSRVSSSS